MAEKASNLNVQYRKAEILSSEADLTRYKGQFRGNCQQTMTLRTPKDLSTDDEVLCDLEVTIGGRQEAVYIKVKIRSYFQVKKGSAALTESDQKHCQKEGFEKASQLFSQFMKLHIGVSDPLPPPEE